MGPGENARRLNRRGTLRPQRGLQRLCARLIDRGLVQPRRNLHLLHDDLIGRGLAQLFGAPLETGERPLLREADAIATRLRALLNLP